MPCESVERVTQLLRAAQAGDAVAADQLLAVVYEQLHQLARARMAHLPPGQTLQPTALVHEAYMRLTDKSDFSWESRQHFFFAAARAMRDILVEQRGAGPARRGAAGGTARSWTRRVPSSSRRRRTSSPSTRPWKSWKSRTLSRPRSCCCATSAG